MGHFPVPSCFQVHWSFCVLEATLCPCITKGANPNAEWPWASFKFRVVQLPALPWASLFWSCRFSERPFPNPPLPQVLSLQTAGPGGAALRLPGLRGHSNRRYLERDALPHCPTFAHTVGGHSAKAGLGCQPHGPRMLGARRRWEAAWARKSREGSRWQRSSAASSRSHNAQGGGGGGGGIARRGGDRGGYRDQASKEAKRLRKLRERGGAEDARRLKRPQGLCVWTRRLGETEAATAAEAGTRVPRARASGSRGRRALEVMTVRLPPAASAWRAPPRPARARPPAWPALPGPALPLLPARHRFTRAGGRHASCGLRLGGGRRRWARHGRVRALHQGNARRRALSWGGVARPGPWL
jgi:hypothetical protein